jgi:ribosomal protein L35
MKSKNPKPKTPMPAKFGKTLKLVSKRLKITKGGKVLRRVAGQGHNKSKMPSSIIRSKRKWQRASGHPMIQRALEKMRYSR